MERICHNVSNYWRWYLFDNLHNFSIIQKQLEKIHTLGRHELKRKKKRKKGKKNKKHT